MYVLGFGHADFGLSNLCQSMFGQLLLPANCGKAALRQRWFGVVASLGQCHSSPGHFRTGHLGPNRFWLGANLFVQGWHGLGRGGLGCVSACVWAVCVCGGCVCVWAGLCWRVLGWVDWPPRLAQDDSREAKWRIKSCPSPSEPPLLHEKTPRGVPEKREHTQEKATKSGIWSLPPWTAQTPDRPDPGPPRPWISQSCGPKVYHSTKNNNFDPT